VNIGGNYYDKHNSRNPIARMLMQGFYGSFEQLTGKVKPGKAFEVGCGEGYLMLNLAKSGWQVDGIDIDENTIAFAQNMFLQNHVAAKANVGSIYNLAKDQLPGYDLVICCEVLEHLEHPELGLQSLKNSGAGPLVISVPNEPIWRIMNMARGKYLRNLGNTPGHLSHWSKKAFLDLVSQYYKVETVKTPLPWTFVFAV
jgi:2-polyprenyl-3-methyl-5-hydroxy-6-metoxy-1,4-benzoquinol methylase